MKKKSMLIIASGEKNFASSGVGKYILWYKDLFARHYVISFVFQPTWYGIVAWFLRRIFVLPVILKKHYKNHIKIFYDENFLCSRRPRMRTSAVYIIHHYPWLVSAKNRHELLMKPVHYITFSMVLRHISYVVTASSFTYEFLLQQGRAKENHAYCIENCINEHTYAPRATHVSEEYALLSDKYHLPTWTMLLSIAVAERRKNIPTLIRLLRILPRDYHLIRIGKHLPWKEDTLITSLVTQYHLHDRYIHLSHIPEDDLVRFYHCAHAFLFPSLFEWFGRPPVEAQACGCPVITTHQWSLNEVVWASACIVDDPYDEVSYKKQIELLHDQETRNKIIEKWLKNSKRYATSSLYRKRELLLEKIESELSCS